MATESTVSPTKGRAEADDTMPGIVARPARSR